MCIVEGAGPAMGPAPLFFDIAPNAFGVPKRRPERPSSVDPPSRRRYGRTGGQAIARAAVRAMGTHEVCPSGFQGGGVPICAVLCRFVPHLFNDLDRRSPEWSSRKRLEKTAYSRLFSHKIFVTGGGKMPCLEGRVSRLKIQVSRFRDCAAIFMLGLVRWGPRWSAVPSALRRVETAYPALKRPGYSRTSLRDEVSGRRSRADRRWLMSWGWLGLLRPGRPHSAKSGKFLPGGPST